MMKGIWKNKKNGLNYMVLGVAWNATNSQLVNGLCPPLVLYTGEGNKDPLVRDIKEFEEKFEPVTLLENE